MSYPHLIEDFVTGYLNSQGAICERSAYGIVEVLSDQDAEWAGGGHLVLGFDYEAAQEYSGAEFVSYGSPIYSKLVEAALNRHTCALRYVQPAKAAPADWQKKLAIKLGAAATQIEIISTKQYLSRCMRFQFKVGFLAEQREESLVRVWLDGRSASQIDYESLPHIFFDPTRHCLLPELPTEPLGKLFLAALEALTPQIQARRKALEMEGVTILRQDMATTESYFQSLLEDGQSKLAKASLSGEQKAVAEARAKLDNIEHQRRHHLADIEARHRVGHETALLDVACYVVPRWRVTYKLSRSKQQQAQPQPQIIWWDDLLRTFL